MWYKASSVITAILKCKKLSVEKNTHVPSCPKGGNNISCHDSFPDCDGKTQKCQQSLRVVDERGGPTILYFDYYLSSGERDGRIKKQNTTLRLLLQKYEIDEAAMASA
jgi:hypothetical protein